TIGLRGRLVDDRKELKLGDVICYDFEGDGRFDHTTIVTGKDAAGEPLVNAHTFNSRMRYWKYEDSTAYTPNMKYRFFTI
ncbi:amidase domain-containing protein, partial [Planococcus sp. SIMBA_143]